ncbi:MAG: hypothetical protein F7C32_03130 [Desulfurococcales archaeon]|nr:hypothetical protein [Desulfurococcales archaeon]
MPTVHLSVPDRIYSQLKQKAAEMGIQVTDLIKLYINEGLKHGFGFGIEKASIDEALSEFRKEIEDMKKELITLKGRYHELYEIYRNMFHRTELLREIIESRLGPVDAEKAYAKTPY